MKACDPELLFHDLMGEVDGPSHRAVQEHLRRCPSCQQEKREWEGLVSGLRKQAEGAPNPTASSRIEARLAQEHRHRKLPLRRLTLACLAAAACVAFLLLVPSPPASPSSDSSNALAGLRRTQDGNGSWAGRVGPTAFAALAFLESGSSERRGPDRQRIAEALHFLTREREADPREELLRCLVLLAEREISRAKPAPQLEKAVETAFRKAHRIGDPQGAALLRETVAKARKLGLQTEEGEMVLGRLAVGLGGFLPEKTNWRTLSAQLAADQTLLSAREPLLLAGSYLSEPQGRKN